jgi:CRISPR type III-A-associated RAMP protein Csm4
MPTYRVIKLKNLTPLHIGTGKENYDFSSTDLQSDTLSAALAALRAQKGRSDDLESFLKSFSLSSVFPFWENRFFMPKMQGKMAVNIKGEEEHAMRKQLKKVRFVEKEIWLELISGKHVAIDKHQLQGEFITFADTLGTHSKSVVSQRVSVPRGEQGDADPFFFEWKFFDPRGGLFCLLKCEDDLFDEIIELFKLLGENGLGTDKNIGGGKFDVEMTELDLPEIKDATHKMLLSLYIPTEAEHDKLNLTQSKFSLMLRGGFMAGSSEVNFRHLRKKSVYMFTVGSIFNCQLELTGEVVDLRPDWDDAKMHPVYRSGLAFSIPVKIAENE